MFLSLIVAFLSTLHILNALIKMLLNSGYLILTAEKLTFLFLTFPVLSYVSFYLFIQCSSMRMTSKMASEDCELV